jgi:hypothetical protein
MSIIFCFVIEFYLFLVAFFVFIRFSPNLARTIYEIKILASVFSFFMGEEEVFRRVIEDTDYTVRCFLLLLI